MRLVIALALLLGLLSCKLQAQTADTTIYTIVEKMPEYDGGQVALLQNLAMNLGINCPQNSEVTGKLKFRFIVNTDGSATDLQIETTPCDGMVSNLEQIIKRWKFTPGEQNGQKVRVYYPVQYACIKLN
ncbi:MAG: energy transducer TonB [Chitinophagales bacterium]